MYCTCGKVAENKDTMLCASCSRELRKRESDSLKKPKKRKGIKPRSEKRAAQEVIYNKRVKVWVRDKLCIVFSSLRATMCHHAMGRIGYADQWAKENDIPLLLDERFWKPVSFNGHTWIHDHPEESIKFGYSVLRTAKI